MAYTRLLTVVRCSRKLHVRGRHQEAASIAGNEPPVWVRRVDHLEQVSLVQGRFIRGCRLVVVCSLGRCDWVG